MTIISSNRTGFGTLSDRVLSKLSPDLQFVLRRLLFVLQTPIDSPRIGTVIASAYLGIKEFGVTLAKPSESFLRIQENLKHLSEAVGEILEAHDYHSLDQPLFRRFSKHPAWALFLNLAHAPENSPLLLAAGTELIVSYEGNRPYLKGFANNLRLTIADSPQSASSALKRQLVIERRMLKISQEAHSIFDCAPPTAFSSSMVETFEMKARHYLTRKQVFATPRNRQSVLNHRTQSHPQVIRSSTELREQAHKGSPEACLTILAFCCGLSVELTRELPLDHTSDDWLMTLDLAAGILKTNIESLLPNSATPARDTATAHHAANKIVAKPLPAFLTALLNKIYSEHASAKTVGDLLPASSFSSKIPTIPDLVSAIVPSTARYLNSAAPFAIQLGINRLATVIITNDFSVIPGSKLYYCQVNREEIWQASKTLFTALEWGEPVGFVDGIAVGSQVIPTREAVTNLFAWMTGQISTLAPGKRYTLDSLIKHHNAFAVYCASFAACCLACREAEEYQFTAASLNELCSFTSLSDKRTGQFPGALPLPVNKLLAEQLRLWNAHCRAMDARLAKRGYEANSKIRIHINAVLDHHPVKLFFHISAQKIIPIGSSQLSDQWPATLKLKGNLGRDFWERELHLAGIQSTKIDMLLRHQLLGMESFSSTTNIIQSEWGREICTAQETLFRSMGIHPVCGLAKN